MYNDPLTSPARKHKPTDNEALKLEMVKCAIHLRAAGMNQNEAMREAFEMFRMGGQFLVHMAVFIYIEPYRPFGDVERQVPHQMHPAILRNPDSDGWFFNFTCPCFAENFRAGYALLSHIYPDPEYSILCPSQNPPAPAPADPPQNP